MRLAAIIIDMNCFLARSPENLVIGKREKTSSRSRGISLNEVSLLMKKETFHSFVPNCRGGGESKKIDQRENYQDFLKIGQVFLGHSLIMIKLTLGFFSQNLQFDLSCN